MRRRKFFAAGVLLLTAMLFGAETSEAAWKKPQAKTAAKPEGLMIRTVQIPDPQMSDIPAARAALPEGWKLTKSDVLWNFNMISDPAHVLIEIEKSTDGARFGMVSPIHFIAPGPYSQGLGLLVKQPVSPEDYIRELLNGDRTLSDVSVTKVSKPQAIAEALEKTAAVMNQQGIEEATRRGLRNPANRQTVADVALVDFTCLKDGRRQEGGMMVGIFYVRIDGGSVMWNTTNMFAVAADEGKLRACEREFAAIMANTSINPAWEEVRGQVTNYLQQQNIRAQEAQIRINDAALQRQIQDTYNYISKNRREVLDNQADSASRISRGWTDTITGTDRWSGSGESYSAPTGYDYGWRSSDGNTYYTSDSGFDPNHSSNFSGDWTPMQKVPW
ncbi:MAG: hypothetical protein LBR61_09945 [Synergistaceae bacterium]|jgi:hypothetical protein|nr:hypothetical protein [Synergistaceae bacterium]